ncbi:DUF1353 domain-containing protein [Francisella hispaniensis]|uniref:DUF1353 domain-containing protein n=1 Tax=Francisella hispaniensis TaxID=622488 RepID=F4BFR4_9GAMM|nr:DUF1353 domain-containing protein [Francisella hispaniensis]AEE26308.1 hypothetical protein FN3523_1005 [Francisella hispaniensis]
MNQLVVSVNDSNRVVYLGFEYKNIVVPQGFEFNGNSIPRAFNWFLGKYEYLQASCVHDYLYNSRSNKLNISRKQADEIYKKILIELGCPKLKAHICYFFIRFFGSKYYKK